MSGFILEYGTKDRLHHVCLDLGSDAATVWLPSDSLDTFAKWTGTMEEFESIYPEIVCEMVAMGALKRK
jgi:hypothetical protein